MTKVAHIFCRAELKLLIAENVVESTTEAVRVILVSFKDETGLVTVFQYSSDSKQ